MARQRKNAANNNSLADDKKSFRSATHNGTSSSSAGSQSPLKAPGGEKQFIVMTQWRIILGCICLAIASYFGFLGYLETRVNTPFDNEKMVQHTGLQDPDKYWGTYRPGVYFGLKTRDPYSLVMGLMWYVPRNIAINGEGIRHWCEIGDKLSKYGWLKHDGKSFGTQEIHDTSFTVKTSFVKIPGKQFGGEWTARITVDHKNHPNKEKVALIWYTALDEKTDGTIWSSTTESIPYIAGETVGLGKFRVAFHKINGTILHSSYLSTTAHSLKYIRETVAANLRLTKSKKHLTLPGEILVSKSGEQLKANFVATQIVIEPPFTLDIAYQSVNEISLHEENTVPPIGDAYSIVLANKEEEFSQKFEETFKLAEKGYGVQEINFAQSALSNMLGGIGYFYGSSRVQSVHTKKPVPYWKAPLYTAVPSRSFFPRGFLWDEGFHGLLIMEWDLDIELDIICHWFDLINIEGWIPREQILDVESLAKVPEQFVTQLNSNANPPTFFLTLKKIISKHQNQFLSKKRIAILERLYPRLQAWFNWYNSTQKGELPGTYRWRGRDEDSKTEINPKTLTSGLDDYPRASHPTYIERHVDLRCWIAYAAGVMAEFSTLLGRDDIKYWETFSYLSDNTLLDKLHLSPYTETYSDYGLHTDSIILQRPQQLPSQAHQQLDMIRAVLKEPELKYVDTSYGYVSLFPFLLEIINPDSPRLGKILKDIRDTNILWTKYGLRSLSKNSPLYMKRNTEHDPPYWRGQIWININFLVLKALHNYANQPGPFAKKANDIYTELRLNLVTNIFNEYQRTGYIWEQYNDRTGQGSGCHPFTGWSALIVLIMSEKY